MARTRPLTPEQANWLRVNAYLPPLAFVGSLAMLGVMLSCMLIISQGHAFVVGLSIAALVLTSAVGTLTARHARNNYLDWRDGVAQVQVARLSSKREQRLRGGNRYYLRFDGVDELEALPELYQRAREGERHTVVYSPRARRCWEAQPIIQESDDQDMLRRQDGSSESPTG